MGRVSTTVQVTGSANALSRWEGASPLGGVPESALAVLEVMCYEKDQKSQGGLASLFAQQKAGN